MRQVAAREAASRAGGPAWTRARRWQLDGTIGALGWIVRFAVVVAGLIATIALARESNAQSSPNYTFGARSRVGGKGSNCSLASCGLPVFGVVSGGAASFYLAAWAARKGELPVGSHVAGALVGGLATTTAILYATTNDPALKYQTFGTLACLGVGVPAIILGLHGLVSSDTAREQEKPGPVPNWYAPSVMRIHGGPAAIADAHGALSPGVSLGGVF